MRIALATDWFAPRLGGIESQLFRLAQGLAARQHEVDVITSTPGAVAGPAFAVRSLDVPTIPALHLAFTPSLFAALQRELRRGYDVVHAHVSVVSPVGYAAAIVARAMQMPTVLTFHSVLHRKRFVIAAVDAAGALSGSAVTWSAVSALVARQLGSALHRAPIVVLPNGIDLPFWQRGQHERVGAPRAADVTLVTAMRLHRKKRPRQLLRAFASACARGSVRTRLLIVGDGPERDALARDIRELGLASGSARAELHPWQNADALRALYRDVHAFVLPSVRESFGIAALEARAAGIPVIAMQASGSSEFLRDGENALLCDDDADLRRAIRSLIGDERLRARLAASQVPLDRYDWPRVIVQHEETYQRARERAADRGAPDAS